MKVEKKDLGKSELELMVEVMPEELTSSIERAVEAISKEVKIEGFRPGKATYEALKQKVGEIAILEEAARYYISKHLEKIITENSERQAIGEPQISITKLAPGNPLEFKINFALLPEVTLGQYKDLGVEQETVEASEEEVDKLLGELSEMRIQETASEAAIKDGDKVLVDINIFLDNVPVEGGQGKDTSVVIGKGYVVPGFDQNLIGLNKGDEKSFQLHYPEDHHQKNLAGKMADFKVKVKEVFNRVMPELNDQFAETFGEKKMEDLKKNIRETIAREKQQKSDQKTEIELLDKVIASAKFGDIPETVIKGETENMLHELKHNVEQYGGKFEDYLTSINKNHNQLMLDMMPEAVKRIKTALLIKEIAQTENVKVEDGEIEHEIEHILSHYQGDEEVAKRVKSQSYKNYLGNTIMNRKVISLLREWNVKK